MSRHPFSRRAHRRKRTGNLPCVRIAAKDNPFAEIGDGWLRLTPRWRKITGKRVVRWSPGRRGGWKPRHAAAPITLRLNDPL